jgi:hypothetical protein
MDVRTLFAADTSSALGRSRGRLVDLLPTSDSPFGVQEDLACKRMLPARCIWGWCGEALARIRASVTVGELESFAEHGLVPAPCASRPDSADPSCAAAGWQ